MPTYTYRCRQCSQLFDAIRRMEQRSTAIAPCCSVLGDLDFAAVASTVQVQTFNPYIDRNIPGSPRVESKRQRDALLARAGFTYDGNRYGSHTPKQHDLTSDALTREILDKAHSSPPQSLVPMTAEETQPLRSVLPVKLNE